MSKNMNRGVITISNCMAVEVEIINSDWLRFRFVTTEEEAGDWEEAEIEYITEEDAGFYVNDVYYSLTDCMTI
jgi:hypothetical protein